MVNCLKRYVIVGLDSVSVYQIFCGSQYTLSFQGQMSLLSPSYISVDVIFLKLIILSNWFERQSWSLILMYTRVIMYCN